MKNSHESFFQVKKKSSKGGRPWNLYFFFSSSSSLGSLLCKHKTLFFLCVVLLKYSLAGFLKFSFVLCLAQRSL